MKKTLLIGYGNTLRGDDGAGVRAVTILSNEGTGADCFTTQELHPEIAETMTEYQSVIFFDAALDTDCVQLTRIRPTYLDEFDNTHTYSPQALVNVCHALYRAVPANTYLIRIPAYNIEFSENLSSETNDKTLESVEAAKNIILLQDQQPVAHG